jgi:hypothetical protein
MGKRGPANASIKEPEWGRITQKKRNQAAPVWSRHAGNGTQGYRRRYDLWAKGEGGACPGT